MTGSVKIAREVLESRTARRVKGCLIDVQTANAICTVADALGPEKAARFDKMPIAEAGILAWRVMV